MKLKQGSNNMSTFGDVFEEHSYCWLKGTELWLSLIAIKKEHQGKGSLHKLLEDAKEGHSKVIIPTPSPPVISTAAKHGYKLTEIGIKDTFAGGGCSVSNSDRVGVFVIAFSHDIQRCVTKRKV